MTLLKTGMRHVLRRPLLALLCVLGVALGVAVIIAIDLANASASRAFKLSTDTVSGRATHQVVSAGGTLDQAIFARVKREAGVREAAPLIDAYATAIDLDAQPLRVLGVDVFYEAPFRTFLSGDRGSSLQQTDFSRLISQPDGVVLSADFASRYGLQAGGELRLRVGDTLQSLRVIGLLETDDVSSRRALDGLGLVDIGTAQKLFDLPGRITSIDLIADERTPAGRETLARVRAVLPVGADIVKPSARSNSIESLTDAFELNLTALSLLALVVGIFLIYNTITFSVVQRRPVFGTLRCLGVTRREIFGMVLAEAAVFGVIGGVLGVLLGILLGRGAVRLVTQTINDLYYVVNVRNIEIPPLVLIKGFLLGMLAALLAALAPAFEATSIAPVTALKRSSIESRVRTLLPRLALCGLAVLALGGLALVASQNLVLNFAGIFAVVIGAALLAPLLTVGLMRLATPVADRFGGALGRMATRAVTLSLSRTGIAIASLMIAISVIIGLQSMINSFRSTVNTWLSATLVADVYIAPSGGVSSNSASTYINPNTVEALRTATGVNSANLYRRGTARFAVGETSDPAALTRQSLLIAETTTAERDINTSKWGVASGGSRARWDDLAGGDRVLVSEPFANKHGITQQINVITLATDDGPRRFEVRGVYYDYGSDQGVVLMRRDQYQRYWRDDKVSSMALFLKPESLPRVQDVVDDLRRQFAAQDLVISANSQLRANALAIFDRTFAITGALNLLATLVAFIGVLSALMAMLIERTREFGVLRATGLTLPQLAGMVLTESALIGGTAGLLSVPTGLALAFILIYIINLRAFGWTIALDLQAGTFVQAFAIAVISALLAAIYPVLRLRGIQIAQAVRAD